MDDLNEKLTYTPLHLFSVGSYNTSRTGIFHFEKYFNTEDGLSSSHVNDIYKDSKGFMWFLTGTGVDRYDGINIESYEIDAAVQQEGGYKKMYEDVNGKIWLIFKETRVYYDVYNDKHKIVDIYDQRSKKLNSFNEVFKHRPFEITDISIIHQDEKRVLWFGLGEWSSMEI